MLHDKTVIKPEIATLVEPLETRAPRLKLFLSYSHRNEGAVDELRKDLKVMERNGLILPWHDRALTAGEKWEARILQELRDADVVVCQLSRDFLASDFCVLKELQTAIQRKEAGETELIAYVLEDCGWRDVTTLSEFQVLPKDARPLDEWPTPAKYWRNVAEGIKAALLKVHEQRSRDPRRRLLQ